MNIITAEQVIHRFRTDAPPLLAGHYVFVPHPSEPERIYLNLWVAKVECGGLERFMRNLEPDIEARADFTSRSGLSAPALWAAGMGLQQALDALTQVQHRIVTTQHIWPFPYEDFDAFVAAMKAVAPPGGKTLTQNMIRLRAAWNDAVKASRELMTLEVRTLD